MFKIAIKYMHYQKKNYIATILIGIIAIAVLVLSLILHEYDLIERETLYYQNNAKYNLKINATQNTAEDVINQSKDIEKITVVNENLELTLGERRLKYKVYDKDNYEDILKIDMIYGRMPKNENEVIISKNAYNQYKDMEIGSSLNGNVEDTLYDSNMLKNLSEELVNFYMLKSGMGFVIDYGEMSDSLLNKRLNNESIDYSKKILSKEKDIKIVGIYINKSEKITDENSNKFVKYNNFPEHPTVIAFDKKENILNTNTIKTYYCNYTMNSKSVQEAVFTPNSPLRFDTDMYLKASLMMHEINKAEKGYSTATPQEKNHLRNSMVVTAFIAELSPVTLGVFIGLFMVAAMINSFNISINERIKQIGTLKAIGATPRQIGQMILYEIIILIILIFPLGFFIGKLSSNLILEILKNNYGYGNYIISSSAYMQMLLISFITLIICISISSNASRYKAKKMSAIEALTSSTIYKNKGDITSENSKFINKHFKIEIILADKDISSNISKYRICFISLAIGMIFLMFMINKTVRIGNSKEYALKSTNWSIEYTNLLNTFSDEDIYELQNISGVKNVFKNSNERTVINIPEEYISDNMLTYLNSKGSQNNTEFVTEIISGDDEIFKLSKDYLKEGTLNYNNFEENDIVLINEGYKLKIIDNDFNNSTPEYLDKITKYTVGDKIKLQNGTEYNIAAIISENPLRNIKNNTSTEEILKDSDISIIIPEKFSKMPTSKVYLSLENENRNDIIENINKVAERNGCTLKDYTADQSNIEILNKRYTILDLLFTLCLVIIVLLNLINTLNLVTLSRKGELATLRAIGMEKVQLKKHIVSSGLIVCIYSILMSVLVGGILILSAQKNEIYTSSNKLQIITIIIIVCIILQLLIAIISSLLPLKKLLKLSISDEMRV